ncbi:MAG: EamA family transporter [Coprothermobacterota bacterium]|nr:EamA family transporter [Coprothermobacterota bacterium]
MKKAKVAVAFPAFLAAFLYGAGFPVCKIFLAQIDPIPLLSLISFGEGMGFSLILLYQRKREAIPLEAKISRSDLLWLLSSIALGGVIAPTLVLLGLEITPAVTASLLLNFETVATVLIAALFFREAVGGQIWSAVFLILAGSVLLSLDFTSPIGISLGAIAVLMATIFWALNRNIARNISGKDPLQIMMIRGFVAGTCTLIIAFLLGQRILSFWMALLAMLLGFICFGLGYVFELQSLRHLGASRTGAIVTTNPFVSVVFSLILFKEGLNWLFYLALPLILFGLILILSEKHSHSHFHEPCTHDHRHRHDDGHHFHTHKEGEIPKSGYHSHVHSHELLVHTHPHTPDIHHRHSHRDQKRETPEIP